MFSKTATDEMIAQASPPDGFYSIVSNSPFGWEVGPFFEKKTDDNTVRRGFRVTSKHLNAGGVCHGGMLMTFADILIASAVFKAAPPPFVTIKLATEFVGAAHIGVWIDGRAEVVGLHDGFATVIGTISEGETVVASVSAVFKSLAPRE